MFYLFLSSIKIVYISDSKSMKLINTPIKRLEQQVLGLIYASW